MIRLIPRFVLALAFSLPLIPVALTAADPDKDSAPASADAQWNHLQELQGKLMSAMHDRDADLVKASLVQYRSELKKFAAANPVDKHVWDAKLLLAQTGRLAQRAQFAAAPSYAEIAQLVDSVVTDANAPREAKAQASVLQIYELFPKREDDKVDWDALDVKIAAFGKIYGDLPLGGQGPSIVGLRQEELTLLEKTGQAARHDALVQKLASDPQPEVVAMVQHLQAEAKAKSELATKPLDLKYTAVDGREVDLASLRGKVVLVDFWATWCGPCVREMPTVIDTYKKYHDQGFEIVGISLDQDKDALLNFTKEHQMPWPQYFDGQGWENKISHGYGIESIPTMWLIDQKGMVVSTDAAEDLPGAVEKVLKK